MRYRRELSHDDLIAIKQLPGVIPVSEIADRYTIRYQRIDTIWKTDISEKVFDEKLTNVDQIIDSDVNDEADRFIEKVVSLIKSSITDLKHINKALQRQISENTNMKIINDSNIVDRLQSKIKQLQRELADTQEQLNDVTHTRDKIAN
ncbi:hypothetical protein ACJMK2_029286 [Sinanodonta woodiana]|uniref:Uncharacterized protein n=1 Tax=Sinanodonta woodiana TaxID=1069815 RepID=A0ABD3XDJ4_SINWO